jgi:tetratricopeptide (TPR) repeat protein
MADPRRHESSSTVSSGDITDRDSRSEALLVDGLDLYFAGRYEDAIHLWTRVLFLDRSHARARAYIDRARSAVAERQRRAEEMLHATGELLERGRTDEARDLLGRAVATSGEDERAAEMRSRLERIERARVGLATAKSPAAIERAAVWSRPSWSPAALWSMLAAVSFLLVAVIGSPSVRDWLGVGPAPAALPAVVRAPLLPVLSSAEAALVRARTLYSRGRLAEALQVLDRVDSESANRPAADRLRVEIQQMLLSARRTTATPTVDQSRGRP